MPDPIKLIKPTINQSCVEILEDYLAKARDGAIESVALIARTPDGKIYTRVSTAHDRHHLLAGTLYIQKDLIRAIDDDDV
jgi:hypothetical protein